MTSLRRFLTAASILAAIVRGQSLRVEPSATDRKSPGVLSLILEAPPGKAPVAMQWEIAVPPAIAVATGDISVGKAAETAKKSLNCATKGGTAGGVRYACILAGGQDPIPVGPVATVRYRAQADVQGAPVRVVIENILGVSADLKRIEISNAIAIIRIQ